jgi:hypothetical protein
MLTRLGEAGADSFTIKRIAGHSSVTVSERYVHPTPEGLERAFEKLERLNEAARQNLHQEDGSSSKQQTGLTVENLHYHQALPTISTTVN